MQKGALGIAAAILYDDDAPLSLTVELFEDRARHGVGLSLRQGAQTTMATLIMTAGRRGSP